MAANATSQLLQMIDDQARVNKCKVVSVHKNKIQYNIIHGGMELANNINPITHSH